MQIPLETNQIIMDSVLIYQNGTAVLGEMQTNGSSTSTRHLGWNSEAGIHENELPAGELGITQGDGRLG